LRTYPKLPFFCIGPLDAAIAGAMAPSETPFEMVFVDDEVMYCCCGTLRLSCGLQSLRLNPLRARQRTSPHTCHRRPTLKINHIEWSAPDRGIAVVAQRPPSGTR
jgi:hypothetical protein